jgi:hypothetical protein
MARRSLSIEYRTLASLRLDPQNPRLHSNKQIRQIARSIEAFGFNAPILIDSQGQVIAGHGRVLAARLLNMRDVPTIALEHLTETQTRAFMIADNRLTENAVWNERLLAEQFESMSAQELNFSVDVTGFEIAEINVMIENSQPASQGKDDSGDVIPDSASKPQVTRRGDLWVLNCHRVYCSEGGNDADTPYCRLMAGQRAGMVFTTPRNDDPARDHSEGVNASGEMSQTEFSRFLAVIFARLVHNSIDGALHFVCVDWRHSGELIAAASSIYTEFSDLCVWVKRRAGHGSLYQSQHELVFVLKSGKKPHHNKSGRSRTNVWQYGGANLSSKAPSTEHENSSELRLTTKPVELVADAIHDSTTHGDIVLDPFLGSGTTVIAAERTGRSCFGIEPRPRYVDTIVRRWQAITGRDAILEPTGQTFNEMEQNNGRTEKS